MEVWVVFAEWNESEIFLFSSEYKAAEYCADMVEQDGGAEAGWERESQWWWHNETKGKSISYFSRIVE